MNLVPVDSDPFAAAAPVLVPVDHDPFAAAASQPDTSRPMTESGFVVPSAADRAAMLQHNYSPTYGNAAADFTSPTGPAVRTSNEESGLAFRSGQISDRATAAAETYLPKSVGGNDKDYATNLADTQAAGNEAKSLYPGASIAGDIAAQLPYAFIPGAGELAAGRAFGLGGGLGARMLGSAALGGGVGAVQGAAGSPDWSDLGQTTKDAGVGLGLGAIGGAAMPLVAPGASKLFSPFVSTLSPDAQRLAAGLREASPPVPLTAGQAVGSDALQRLEGAGAGRAAEGVNKAITQNVLSRAGVDVTPETLATPEVLSANRKALGAQYDALHSVVDLPATPQLGEDVTGVLSNYLDATPQSQIVPKIDKSVQDILRPVNGGDSIPGPKIAAMRQEFGSEASRLAISDPNTAEAYRGLDSVLGNHYEAALPPEMQGQLSTLDRQYAHQRLAENAVAGSAESKSGGYITPASLTSQLTNNAVNKSRFSRGMQDMAPLARGANLLTSPPPSTPSGIGSLVGRHALSHLGGTAIGGYAGYEQGGVPGAIGGAVAGNVAPRLVSSAVRAPWIQSYLANQLAASRALPTGGSALAAALAGHAVQSLQQPNNGALAAALAGHAANPGNGVQSGGFNSHLR